MSAALAEARQFIGATSPNPPVGAAALDKSGRLLAVAAHKFAGGDHAEVALLKICREQNLLPQVETICVTLEPCNHHGRTPPCTNAIIGTGIKRVVIGAHDPNPHVTGGGIEKLRGAGIEMVTGVLEEDCKQMIHTFAFHAETGKPWITIKRAFDGSGSMIPPAGQKTFTSHGALTLAHRLRKKSDVILTGSGTILVDQPLFTVRHVEDYPGKKRWLAILDRRGRVPDSYTKAAEKNGFIPLIYQDVAAAIDDLERRGARDILVEAGPLLSQAMLDYPFWAMSVKIRAGDSEQIEAEFNSRVPIPFEMEKFDWDNFLPL